MKVAAVGGDRSGTGKGVRIGNEKVVEEMSAAADGGAVRRRELAVLVNEFAAVRVSLDTSGNGPRLLVEDTETRDSAFLSPLELACLCLATTEDRENWLRVGAYRDERRDRSLGPARPETAR
jgi:hypothetical protein